MLFVGWEGVGLCSYLLIGYYYDKKFAGDAGKKAFVVNRIGDFGFILGHLRGLRALRHARFRHGLLAAAAQNPAAYAPYMTVVCLLLFVGACGKSAQFPLYVWLPDAMAGPTPVSALIHAATMVTAGVYMVARCNVFFRLAPHAMLVVAVVGAFTALFAATIGLAQNDIKKVLAYSTVSQLGYMFLACGVGAFSEGMFHVMTHAFFKACLFLGSGSVIHALGGEQDIRRMGGLRAKIPKTYRDLSRRDAHDRGGAGPRRPSSRRTRSRRPSSTPSSQAMPWLPKLLYAAALFTAGLTAFYMFRLARSDLLGTLPRDARAGGARPRVAAVDDGAARRARRSSRSSPGWIGIPIVHGGNRIGEFLKSPSASRSSGFRRKSTTPRSRSSSRSWRRPWRSPRSACILACTWYVKGEGRTPARLAAEWPGVYRTVSDKYCVDEAYDRVFVAGLGAGRRATSCGRWMRRSSTSSRTAPRRDHEGCFVDRVDSSISTSSTALVNGVANSLQALYGVFRRAADRPRAELRARDGRRAVLPRGGVSVVSMKG